MRRTLRTLSIMLGAGLLLGGSAHAAVVSVNFGTSANNLNSNETAGVVVEDNWNNATSTSTGNTSNLAGTVVKDGNGANTTVGVSWSGGGLTNNPNLTTGGGTGDQKMMNHFWNTGNALTFIGLFSPALKTFMYAPTNNGPKDNTVTFTNLNATFPNGYDVYVYVSGAGTTSNEQNSGGTPGAGGHWQNANPIAVVAGPAGTNTAAAAMDVGVDNSTINTGGGAGTIKSIMMGRPGVGNNLPGASTAIIWPTTQIAGGPFNGNYTAAFTGTYTTSPFAFSAVDASPIDMNWQQGGGTSFDPTFDTRERLPTDNWSGLNWHIPTDASRFGANAPIGNYVKFSGLSLDVLDILARNLHGRRNNTPGSSGTGIIQGGGITGIQIVGLEAEAEPVPEPATFCMAAMGIVGLVCFAWRQRRRAS